MASSSRLNPGETGRINVRIDTTAIRGRLYKSVGVFTNDTERPHVTLSLTADVKAR